MSGVGTAGGATKAPRKYRVILNLPYPRPKPSNVEKLQLSATSEWSEQQDTLLWQDVTEHPSSDSSQINCTIFIFY
jgi:hypothetical protein